MNMKILLILDPIEHLKSYKDTSIAIMREATNRGHALFIAMQGDLFLRQDKVRVVAQAFVFADGDQWYNVGEANEYAPADFDAVLMRKDPPFDNEYLYSTYSLEIINVFVRF